MRASPALAFSRVPKIRSRVLFPLPFAPRRPTISPG
jgi:hypothetical protein